MENDNVPDVTNEKEKSEDEKGELGQGTENEEAGPENEHADTENVLQKESEERLGGGQEMPNDDTKEELKEGEDATKENTEENAEAVEEEQFVEEPPPDPAAPFNLRDSTEALKPPFQLRPDQLSEVERLWELFQDYNPAYTDLDNYITESELVYMLKSLLLMTYTPEQLQELITFCVRPPNPNGHITFDQFVKIVTIRQRDLPVEEELRLALQSLDPGRTGTIDREFFKELLLKQGNKLAPKLLDNLIKEVDLSNDGTIGIEDVVGTLGIDLNKDDILMLRAAINPELKPQTEDEF